MTTPSLEQIMEMNSDKLNTSNYGTFIKDVFSAYAPKDLSPGVYDAELKKYSLSVSDKVRRFAENNVARRNGYRSYIDFTRAVVDRYEGVFGKIIKDTASDVYNLFGDLGTLISYKINPTPENEKQAIDVAKKYSSAVDGKYSADKRQWTAEDLAEYNQFINAVDESKNPETGLLDSVFNKVVEFGSSVVQGVKNSTIGVAFGADNPAYAPRTKTEQAGYGIAQGISDLPIYWAMAKLTKSSNPAIIFGAADAVKQTIRDWAKRPGEWDKLDYNEKAMYIADSMERIGKESIRGAATGVALQGAGSLVTQGVNRAARTARGVGFSDTMAEGIGKGFNSLASAKAVEKVVPEVVKPWSPARGFIDVSARDATLLDTALSSLSKTKQAVFGSAESRLAASADEFSRIASLHGIDAATKSFTRRALVSNILKTPIEAGVMTAMSGDFSLDNYINQLVVIGGMTMATSGSRAFKVKAMDITGKNNGRRNMVEAISEMSGINPSDVDKLIRLPVGHKYLSMMIDEIKSSRLTQDPHLYSYASDEVPEVLKKINETASVSTRAKIIEDLIKQKSEALAVDYVKSWSDRTGLPSEKVTEILQSENGIRKLNSFAFDREFLDKDSYGVMDEISRAANRGKAIINMTPELKSATNEYLRAVVSSGKNGGTDLKALGKLSSAFLEANKDMGNDSLYAYAEVIRDVGLKRRSGAAARFRQGETSMPEISPEAISNMLLKNAEIRQAERDSGKQISQPLIDSMKASAEAVRKAPDTESALGLDLPAPIKKMVEGFVYSGRSTTIDKAIREQYSDKDVHRESVKNGAIPFLTEKEFDVMDKNQFARLMTDIYHNPDGSMRTDIDSTKANRMLGEFIIRKAGERTNSIDNETFKKAIIGPDADYTELATDPKLLSSAIELQKSLLDADYTERLTASDKWAKGTFEYLMHPFKQVIRERLPETGRAIDDLFAQRGLLYDRLSGRSILAVKRTIDGLSESESGRVGYLARLMVEGELSGTRFSNEKSAMAEAKRRGYGKFTASDFSRAERVAESWRGLLDEAGDYCIEKGFTVIDKDFTEKPFEKMKNYFPKEILRQCFEKDSPLNKDLVQWLYDNKYFKDIDYKAKKEADIKFEIRKRIGSLDHEMSIHRNGNLEHQRVLEGLPDRFYVSGEAGEVAGLVRYFDKVARRIADVETIGYGNEVINGLAQEAIKEAAARYEKNDAVWICQRLDRYVKLMTDRKREDKYTDDLVRSVSKFMVVTKMGLSTVSQFSQFFAAPRAAGTAAGMKWLAKGMYGSFTNKGQYDIGDGFGKMSPKEFSYFTGSLITEVRNLLLSGTLADTDSMGKVLNLYQFTKSDAKSRQIAACTGYFMQHDLMIKLNKILETDSLIENKTDKARDVESKMSLLQKRGGKMIEKTASRFKDLDHDTFLVRKFKQFGVDLRDVIARGRNEQGFYDLTANEKATFARNFEVATNFRTEARDLPDFYRHTWLGQMHGFLKSYSFNRWGETKSFVLKEASYGNLFPLMYLTTFNTMMVAPVLNFVRNIITLTPQKSSVVKLLSGEDDRGGEYGFGDYMFENLMFDSALGVYQDYLSGIIRKELPSDVFHSDMKRVFDTVMYSATLALGDDTGDSLKNLVAGAARTTVPIWGNTIDYYLKRSIRDERAFINSGMPRAQYEATKRYRDTEGYKRQQEMRKMQKERKREAVQE